VTEPRDHQSQLIGKIHDNEAQQRADCYGSSLIEIDEAFRESFNRGRSIGPGYRSHQMLTFRTPRIHLSFTRGYLRSL
jgi:hypothetical protein